MPKTLLLADDSLTIRRVVELTFAEEDIAVVAVGDGGRALTRIASVHPDIVLADASMPAPDGYEIAAYIKSTPELSHIPVILLTAAFQPIDEARARAAGCDAVLAKPFELTLLVGRVKELLRAAEARVAEALREADVEVEGPVPSKGEGGVEAPVVPEADGHVDVAPMPEADGHVEVAPVPEAVGQVEGLEAERHFEGPAAGTDVEGLAEEASAELSLEQLFDSIDTSPAVAPLNGTAPHDESILLPSLVSASLAPASDDGAPDDGLSLDDYFDMVDEAVRRSHEAAPPGVFESPALLFPPHRVAADAAARGAIPPLAAAGEAAGGNGTSPASTTPSDGVARIFLALLDTRPAPPPPGSVEEALRRLVDGEAEASTPPPAPAAES